MLSRDFKRKQKYHIYFPKKCALRTAASHHVLKQPKECGKNLTEAEAQVISNDL